MDYLRVFFVAALPVFEIRGAVPLGIYYGLRSWEALLIGVLGNIAIIMPWLLVLCWLEDFFGENRLTAPLYRSLIRRVEKRKASFAKYGKVALFLFVAVPLPTTGAWTACIASRVFRIPMREAFVFIALGVVAAGVLMVLKTKLIMQTF